MTDSNRTPHSLKPLARFVAAALLSGSVLAADPAAVRFYEDAVTRYNAGDARGALIQLKNSLQRDPGQLPAKILLGRAHLAVGEAALAEEELLQAKQLGADPVLVALPLAQARNALGKYEDNIRDLVPTRAPRAQQPDLWVELGLARLYNDDPGGAGIAFEEALKIDPLHAGARVGLARIPLQKQDFAAAERLADAATSAHPASAAAWFVKASALHGQGRHVEAAEGYARVLALEPGFTAAALGQATALLDAGRDGEAESLLVGLRERYPWMPELPYLQAQALERLGRAGEAESAMKAAAALLDPVAPDELLDNLAMLRLAGTVAFATGQNERAHQALSLYLERRPDDIEVRKTLGRIALAVGKPADARRALAPLLNLGLADAETLGLLGDASAQQNDYIAAESYYRDAINDYRGGPALLGRLGALQFRLGQRDAALQTLGQLDQIPEQAVPAGVSLYSAMLHFAEGRNDEARSITERVKASQPGNLLADNMLAALAIVEGRNQEARETLDAILARAPGFRPARFNLARLELIEGRPAEARRLIDALLTETPTDTRALLETARLDAAAGDRRSAIQVYGKVLELDPGSITAATELAELFLAEGLPAEAMKTALELNRALPRSFHALELLVRVQLARGATDDARLTLKNASVLAGFDPRQLMRTAQLQQAAGAHEEALWTFAKLLEERPEATAARQGLAESLFQLGRLDEAREQLDRILSSRPDDVRALALLGDIYLAQGQFVTAAGRFAEALQHANRPELAVSLFRARTLAGEGEAALAELQAWSGANPGQPLVLRALAERNHQLGQAREALALYEELLGHIPNDAFVHNNIANLLFEVDIERAYKAARRAHELAPSHPSVLDTLGWILVQVGNLPEGLAHLRNAVARNGSSATIRYHLGVALQEFGSREESRRELEQALRLADNADWAEDARRRLETVRQ